MLLLWVWPVDKKGCVRVHHKFPTCRYGWTAPIEKGSWSMNECLKILAPVGCNIFLIVTKLPARISRRGKGLLWPPVHHGREGTEVKVWGSCSYCVCSQEAELADRKCALDTEPQGSTPSNSLPPLPLTGAYNAPKQCHGGKGHWDPWACGEHFTWHPPSVKKLLGGSQWGSPLQASSTPHNNLEGGGSSLNVTDKQMEH